MRKAGVGRLRRGPALGQESAGLLQRGGRGAGPSGRAAGITRSSFSAALPGAGQAASSVEIFL